MSVLIEWYLPEDCRDVDICELKVMFYMKCADVVTFDNVAITPNAILSSLIRRFIAKGGCEKKVLKLLSELGSDVKLNVSSEAVNRVQDLQFNLDFSQSQ